MWHMNPEAEILLAKPVATSVIAGVADRYFLNNLNLSHNAYFGVATGLSVLVADQIAKHTQISSGVGKSIEARVLELGIAVPTTLTMDYYLNRTPTTSNTGKRIIAIAGSEVLGEYVAQSFFGLA